MTATLKRAIAEVAALPDLDQEEIGRKLLSHVERLRMLRGEVEKGLRSLDEGRGEELCLEQLLTEAHERHGRS